MVGFSMTNGNSGSEKEQMNGIDTHRKLEAANGFTLLAGNLAQLL